MTPQDLAARLSQLDWSGCSLQHQLAVAAAVTSLRGRPSPFSMSSSEPLLLDKNAARRIMPVDCGETKSSATLEMGSNVVALVPTGQERTVRLLTLDGCQIAERQFPAGRADGPWSWIRSEVAALAACPPEAVGAAEADTGDFVTVDGIPYARVVLF